jgi:ABC-type branched-subunit amino acid transport system substrate-binding protein
MLWKFSAIAATALGLATAAMAADAPGVTKTEIKIGGVFPFSGPASSIGITGKGLMAYVQSINDRGGINGRKINYIAMDDAYSPPKAVEHVRKLVESDEVAFIYSQLGTPGNSASAKYLIAKGVPTVGIVSGASKFTNVKEFPNTTTALVSFETEGTIYAKYLKASLPDAKYAILFQNDDLGKDYVNAFRAYFKDDFDKKVATAAYEISDPTVDSQVVTLKSSGAQALLIAGTPKFAAQAIRKANEINWKATIMINFPSGSVSSTLKPAGLDVATGVVLGTFNKDPSDPQWANDPGINEYKTFFAKYLPGADIGDNSYLTGYSQGLVLERILTQCGDDLSRENIKKQAKNLKDIQLPITLQGVTINTSETVNQFWTQMQLQRWTGKNWEQFGSVLDARSE